MNTDLLTFLNSKARPATTSGTGIRVLKSKAPVIESVIPIDLHSKEVHFMRLIHHTMDAIDLKMLIIRLWLIETQYISHTRTAPTLHAQSKDLCFIKIRLTHQAADLFDGVIRKCYRCCYQLFHTAKINNLFPGNEYRLANKGILTQVSGSVGQLVS